MDKEFLIGLGISEDIATQIISKHETEINNEKKETEKYKEKSDEYKALLDDANTQIDSYKDMDIETIKQNAEDYKKKYEDLESENKRKEKVATINKSLEIFKFSSETAKETIVNKILEKDLKIEDGKVLGLDDFINAAKEKDSGLILPNEDPKDPAPKWGDPYAGDNTKLPGDNPIKFNFSGVRPITESK